MANETSQGEAFSGKKTIDTALQLIRYDIPVLILGKSSIGKSYTLIDITEKWNISHQLLYIGSEKSENIEGVPKLTERRKGKEILEYLQPYWFPNASVITKSVTNGRKVFDEFIGKYWDVKTQKEFKPTYPNLMSILNALSNVSWTSKDLNQKTDTYSKSIILKDTEWITETGGKKGARTLNTKEFKIEKKGVSSRKEDGVESELAISDEYNVDDLKDFCAYLTTCLGYGNFWLILDEIDKVEEMEKDKFAPLLHIVRERTLKNYRMIDINGGKGLGIPLGKSFQKGEYANIVSDVNRLLDAGESVLDTRVIAIANKTKNIEEALFRRFVQLIAEEVMIWRPEDLDKGETKIEGCLTHIKKEMVSAGLESGSLMLGLKFQKLDEINLQWQYNFFPKMLNNNDIQGNYFKIDALQTLKEGEDENIDWASQRKFTAFYKILSDNYREIKTSADPFRLPSKLFSCLENQLIEKGTDIGISKKTKDEQIKGIRGVLAQKEKEIGDHSLIALEIEEKLRDAYPKKIKKDTDKLNLLYLWTDNVIEYLNGAIYSNPTTVAPLEVSKHLIPSLVNVFYTEIAKDQENIGDNMVAITEKFQAFFKEVYQIDPSFSITCNKEATQQAFYGGSEKELKAFTEDELKAASENTLFGTDDKNWINSASGNLALNQMRDGLALTLPLLVQELGYVEAAEMLLEHPDAIRFLQNNLKVEMSGFELAFKSQAKSLTGKAGKEKARTNFHQTGELVAALVNSEI